MNDAKIKAVRIIERLKWESYAGNGLFVIEAVEALSRAGLLRTALHERALEACKAAFSTLAGDDITNLPALRRWYECCDVGREALALERSLCDSEKPKERWTVKRYDDNGLRPWRVFDALMPNGAGNLGGCCAKFSAEADARAYADQKNREGGR